MEKTSSTRFNSLCAPKRITKGLRLSSLKLITIILCDSKTEAAMIRCLNEFTGAAQIICRSDDTHLATNSAAQNHVALLDK